MSTLTEKLLAIQSELHVPKSQTNAFGKYKYRSCEDILEAVKPLVHKQGCVLLIADDIVEIGGRVYVKATVTIGDGSLRKDSDVCTQISVNAFARESLDKKGMDDSQITGAASSYARKYALNGLFCIDDTKDADTMDNQREPVKKREEVDKAHTGRVMKIADLCTNTDTDQTKLYEFFGVKGVPTEEQAVKMIASLEKKLSDQLDSQS